MHALAILKFANMLLTSEYSLGKTSMNGVYITICSTVCNFHFKLLKNLLEFPIYNTLKSSTSL